MNNQSNASYYSAGKKGKIVISVTKATKNTPVGIAIGRNVDLNGLVITKISDSSLFAQSELKVGQKIVSINGTPCTSSSIDTIKDVSFLVKATVGELTLVVEDDDNNNKSASSSSEVERTKIPEKQQQIMIMAKVEKFYKEENLGISFMEDHTRDGLFVSNIMPQSPFGKYTKLKVGMRVLSINDVEMTTTGSCGFSRMEMAKSILREAVQEVSIVASACDSAKTSERGNEITVKIHKKCQQEKSGIVIKRGRKGTLYVSRISTTSPFASTQLKVGNIIRSINGVEMTGESVEFAVLLLKDSIGEVVVVVVAEQASDDEETTTTASHQKKSPYDGHLHPTSRHNNEPPTVNTIIANSDDFLLHPTERNNNGPTANTGIITASPDDFVLHSTVRSNKEPPANSDISTASLPRTTTMNNQRIAPCPAEQAVDAKPASVTPDAASLTLERKSRCFFGVGGVFKVYVNEENNENKVGKLYNGGELVIPNLHVGDVVIITGWRQGWLTFRIAKPGNQRLRVKMGNGFVTRSFEGFDGDTAMKNCNGQGIVLCQTNNPDVLTGAFDYFCKYEQGLWYDALILSGGGDVYRWQSQAR